MIILILGGVIFFGVHAVPSFGLKKQLSEGLGRGGYLGLFSVLSTLGLGLIVYGKGSANFVSIWSSPEWSFSALHFVMWPTFILISWAYLPCNMKRILRHPMLIGVVVFSIFHLIANGDLASILLFVSFGIFALLNILFSTGPVKQANAHRGSLIWDFIGVLIGSAAYFTALNFHQQIAGIAI